MNPISTDFVSMDSQNTRSQEHKIDIPSTPSLSGLGSTHGLNTLSQNHGINIPSTSKGSPPQPTNLACADLLNGSREEYIKICVPLYEASITGDWQAAKVILDKRPELVRFAITKFHDTTLHVAASGEDTKLMESFVESLVDRMEKVDLEIRNIDSDTALCVTAATGSTKMAMIMVNKHKALLNIPGNYGMLPLSASALHGNHDMVEYLYDASEKMAGEFWTDQDRSWVLCNCVKADIFEYPILTRQRVNDIFLRAMKDQRPKLEKVILYHIAPYITKNIAQKILIDRPELATYKFNCWFVLDALAQKPSALNRKKGNIISTILYPIFALMNLKMGPPDKGYEALSLLKTMLDITTKVPQVDIGDIHREDGTNINRPAVQQKWAILGL